MQTPPIRLTLLTGFLGAGKTTLLNRFLGDPALKNTAVVVNEFGEAAIDPLLIEAVSSDGVISLSDGCLCCTVRGELVQTLVDLAVAPRPAGTEALERVVVETTGLADPGPILAALMSHPALLEAYALDGVVTVVDAMHGAATLAAQIDSRRQVAVADRIILTKSDLATSEAATATRTALRHINPRAPILDAAEISSAKDAIVGCGVSDAMSRTGDIAAWLGTETTPSGDPAAKHEPDDGHAHDHHHHGHSHSDHDHHRHDGIRSFSLETAAPITFDAVSGFLELLTQTAGPRILRMKGVVLLSESPDRPLVLHGVQGYLHPPAQLSAWPGQSEPKTRIVLIGQSLDERYVRDLFAAFTGGIRPDAPDRRALEDNPLAVPGVRFG